MKALAGSFRMVHTIKGTSGFFGFGKLEKITHVGENLLSRLRDGELKLSPEMTTALLKTADAIRQMLGSIEATGNEGERDDRQLLETLTRMQQMESVTVAAAANGDLSGEHVNAAAPADQFANSGKSQASESTIRVDVGLLDKLMNLVGELVLARNQILQFTNSIGHNGLLTTSQRLNLITTELQEGVMKTRMQPIGNVWAKFPRTVRDVATQCGKQVRIEMEGRETAGQNDYRGD